MYLCHQNPEDEETKNNTDSSSNKNVETMYESGTYYFSSAQDPSEGTSVYGSPENFALAMFQCSAPTLLAYGGTYADVTNIPIENILPFSFLFGIGGPKMNQEVKVSLVLCIQLYLWLSLQQFMEGPTILVLNHIYNRQMSYISGVMTCRSTVNRVSLGEKLSKYTRCAWAGGTFFPVVLLCIFLFWQEIGFGFTYLRTLLNKLFYELIFF
jgi:hypothetical protein